MLYRLGRFCYPTTDLAEHLPKGRGGQIGTEVARWLGTKKGKRQGVAIVHPQVALLAHPETQGVHTVTGHKGVLVSKMV